MTITNRIQILCAEYKISLSKLESSVGLSNGQIRKWGEVSPKTENLLKVANFFGVSLDFLTGRPGFDSDVVLNNIKFEEYLTEKESHEFYATKLKNTIDSMSSKDTKEVLRFAQFMKDTTDYEKGNRIPDDKEEHYLPL